MQQRSQPSFLPFVKPATPVGPAPILSGAGGVVGDGFAGQRSIGGSLAASLDVTLSRLEEAIDQETAALRAGGKVDLESFNVRKSQGLLELTRLLRNMQNVNQSPELIKRIGQLQSKLAINRSILKMHLEAVREISVTLTEAIQEAESDGTYSMGIRGRRQ